MFHLSNSQNYEQQQNQSSEQLISHTTVPLELQDATSTMNCTQPENEQFEIPGQEKPGLAVRTKPKVRLDRSSCRQGLISSPNNDSKSFRDSTFSEPFRSSVYQPTSLRRKQTSPDIASPYKTRNGMSSKMRLMVFIKIILKCLDQSDDPSISLEAKRVIHECTKMNREGHPDYIPLDDAINRALRLAVGEVNWRRAEKLMDHYISMQNSQTPYKSFKSDLSHFASV